MNDLCSSSGRITNLRFAANIVLWPEGDTLHGPLRLRQVLRMNHVRCYPLWPGCNGMASTIIQSVKEPN